MQQQFHDLDLAFITKKLLSIATRQQLLTVDPGQDLCILLKPDSDGIGGWTLSSPAWQHPSLNPSHSSLLHFADHVFVFIRPDWDGKEDWTLGERAVVKSSSCLFSLPCVLSTACVSLGLWRVWCCDKMFIGPSTWSLGFFGAWSPAGNRRTLRQWITLILTPSPIRKLH